MPNLDTIPDVPFNTILKLVDIGDVLNLRKVSRGVRQFIDTEHPDLELKSIRILWNTGMNEIELGVLKGNEVFIYRYIQIDGKCEVKYSRRFEDREEEKCVYLQANETEFVDIVMNHLELFLSFQRTSVLNEFVMGGRHLMHDSASERQKAGFVSRIYEKLGEMLERRGSNLRVKELFAHFYTQNQSLNVLQHCNPTNIHSLNLTALHNNKKAVKMDRIVETNVWKNAKRAYLENFVFMESLRSFENFERFIIDIPKCRAADVVLLKEMCQRNPQFETCLVHAERQKGIVLDALGIPIEAKKLGSIYYKMMFETPGQNLMIEWYPSPVWSLRLRSCESLERENDDDDDDEEDEDEEEEEDDE